MKNKKEIVFIIFGVIVVIVFCFLFFSTKDSSSNNEQAVNVKSDENDEKNIKEYERFFALPKHATLDFDSSEKFSDDKDELKAQIRELRAKNKLLYDDNLELVNKNYEIALMLDDEKNKIKEIKHQIQAKNLESINETEKQHYQNINELTKRINELQKESLATTKDYEQKIVSMENEIERLQTELRAKDMLTNDEVAKATKNERIKNSSLAEKNLFLINEIEKLKQNSSLHADKLLKDIVAKKAENEKLKQTILDKENLINQILAQHTAEIIEFDKKAQAQIKKIKQDFNALKEEGENDLNNVKKQYQEEIAKLNEQIKNLVNDKKDELKSAIKKALEQKDEQILILQTKLAEQNAKNIVTTKDSASLKDEQNYKILNDRIIILERQNKALQLGKKNTDELNTSLASLRLDKEKLIEENNALQDKIKQINIKLSEYTSKDLDGILNEQNKKLQEYNIENESLKLSLRETERILSDTQKQLEFSMNENQTQDYESKNTIRNMQKQIDDKNIQIEKISSANKELVKESATLKAKISDISSKISQFDKLNKDNANLKNTIQEEKQKNEVLSKLNEQYKLNLDDKIKELNSLNTTFGQNLNDAKKQIINLTAIVEENKEVISKLKENNEEYILKNTNLTQKIQALKQKFDSLSISNKKSNDSLLKAENEIEKYKQELKEVNDKSIVMLDENNKLLSQNEALKKANQALDVDNKSIKKELETIKKDMNARDEKNSKLLAQNLKTITDMESKIKSLESSKHTEKSKDNKRILVKTIYCDDLKPGQKGLSDSCKSSINDTLKDANNSYVYEIEAVVDTDGFTTLNTLNKNGNISNSEYERLTNFANFGLGASRGKNAIDYILGVNPDANVYLSKDLIVQPNKRGFVLKIYNN